ncbi:hypothetical protein F4778DRAFT_721227 [Xylariomycetidae sp. FL2044]|nr:hypothetical protein F4778DRAFT_721227 [Xylariomycetidae sp. FL2044]
MPMAAMAWLLSCWTRITNYLQVLFARSSAHVAIWCSNCSTPIHPISASFRLVTTPSSSGAGFFKRHTKAVLPVLDKHQIHSTPCVHT